MRALVLVILLAQSTNLMAGGVFTGENLLDTCESNVAMSSGICAGYITGVAAGAALMRELGGMPGHCRPDGVNNSQLVEAVVVFLRAHPEARHEQAQLLVFNALSAAWPCQEVKS